MSTTDSKKQGLAAASPSLPRRLWRHILPCFFCVAVVCFYSGRLAYGAATEGDNKVPQEVFDGMAKNFHADKAKGVQCKYLFEISGPHGGDWWIEVRDGKFRMGKGKIENPHVVFVASDQDWVALSNDKLPGWWAYLSGRLKIKGDQHIARKLGEMFN